LEVLANYEHVSSSVLGCAAIESMSSVVSAPVLVSTRALNPVQTHACRPRNGREC